MTENLQLYSDNEEISENEMCAALLSPLLIEGLEEVIYLQPTYENILIGSHILVNMLGGYWQTINYKCGFCIKSVLSYDDDDDDNFDVNLDTKILVMRVQRIEEHTTTTFF